MFSPVSGINMADAEVRVKAPGNRWPDGGVKIVVVDAIMGRTKADDHSNIVLSIADEEGLELTRNVYLTLPANFLGPNPKDVKGSELGEKFFKTRLASWIALLNNATEAQVRGVHTLSADMFIGKKCAVYVNRTEKDGRVNEDFSPISTEEYVKKSHRVVAAAANGGLSHSSLPASGLSGLEGLSAPQTIPVSPFNGTAVGIGGTATTPSSGLGQFAR
mgnify:CR=1 FL=1